MFMHILTLIKNIEVVAKFGKILKECYAEIKKVGAVKTVFMIASSISVIVLFYEFLILPRVVENARISYEIEEERRLEAEHDKLLMLRDKYKVNVDNVLKEVINTLSCDRAYVFEMHNGSNNTSGLPFKYAQMNYEEASKGTRYVCELYKEVNISNYTIPLYVVKNGFWFGNIEELREVDPKMAQRIEDGDGKVCAFMIINGLKGELGCIGITYTDTFNVKSRDVVRYAMTTASQRLPYYLDKNILLENNP